MRNVAYLGHGAEIEEDVVRLRRRKLEFDSDAAHRPRPASGQDLPPGRRGGSPPGRLAMTRKRLR